MRRRVDGNQRKLVEYWRKLGGSYQDLSQLPGVLDGIAGVAGVDQRVEIKDGSQCLSARKLTDAERKVFRTWVGRRPVIWACEEDVLRTFVEMRSVVR